MPAHRSDRRILGTTSIYLMCNLPHLFRSKFGISDKPEARRAGVDNTTSGAVYKLFSFRTLHGHRKEKFVHALYFWANAPFKRGSGRSEWFFNVSPICGLAFYWMAPGAPLLLQALVFVTPLFWLDGMLMMAAFVALDLSFFVLVAWAAWAWAFG